MHRDHGALFILRRWTHEWKRNQQVANLQMTSLEQRWFHGCDVTQMLLRRIHAILLTPLSHHVGCWWLGACLVPGHLQPSCWYMLTGTNQKCPLWYQLFTNASQDIVMTFTQITAFYFFYFSLCFICNSICNWWVNITKMIAKSPMIQQHIEG